VSLLFPAALTVCSTQPLETLSVAVAGKLSQTHGDLQALIEVCVGLFQC
jgi:hypothetical protein